MSDSENFYKLSNLLIYSEELLNDTHKERESEINVNLLKMVDNHLIPRE